ncbi:MAG: GNAT family N-acetyltransferase [Gaiellaceae bacterium]
MSIRTERLLLEPLEPAHAVEMAPLLDDPALYAYTGGEPLSADALRARYERQVRGPETGSGRWFNWILRDRAAGEAVGFVQATVDDRVADVAWVVASPYQGRGYAREAAAAMVAWLRDGGIERVTAHIHPENAASAAVARAIGLAPTDVVLDGEVRWGG